MFFLISFWSVRTLRAWSMYIRQLLLITVHTTLLDAKSKSKAIGFCLITFERLVILVARHWLYYQTLLIYGDLGCLSFQEEHHSSWKKTTRKYGVGILIIWRLSWSEWKIQLGNTMRCVISVTTCISFRCEFPFQGSGSICSRSVVLEWPIGKLTLFSFCLL